MATGCPMMKMQKKTDHPCFGGDHSNTGRIHLPVAPGCNIKCGFCERRFDCANETRPGVTSKVLSPEQAIERVRLVRRHPKVGSKLKVVGIAGPGDPLANPKTFETFELVKKEFPEMHLCLSTNGLMLEESLPEILAAALDVAETVEHDVDLAHYHFEFGVAGNNDLLQWPHEVGGGHQPGAGLQVSFFLGVGVLRVILMEGSLLLDKLSLELGFGDGIRRHMASIYLRSSTESNFFLTNGA